MNRTAYFAASTLDGRAIALCCGLLLTAVGCVGSIGGGDSQGSENATGSDDSGDGDGSDNESKISLGAGGAVDTAGADGTGSSLATDGTPNPAGIPCVYPAGDGDWAVEIGSTLPQSLEWQGFAEHDSSESTVKIEDYLDCDGSKGVNAILFDTSAIWCGSCQYHALMLAEKMESSWAAKGIRVVTFMIQDGQGNPATVQDASNWRNSFNLDATAVVADPDFTFVPPSNSVALPMMVVVNPRNMQIVAAPAHAGQAEMLVEQLAASNQLP